MWAKQVKEAQSFSKTKTGKANSIGIINPNEEFIDSNAPYGGRLEKWRTKNNKTGGKIYVSNINLCRR